MPKIKSEKQTILQGEGILNSTDLDNLILENDDEGEVYLTKALKDADGKYVKFSLTIIEDLDIPRKDEEKE